MLILASTSPRRRALLRAAGIEFRAVAPISQELGQAAPGRYADLVRRSALRKARDVANRCRGVVLAADTIVVCAGEVMGKPRDRADARHMLRRLSGRRHYVYTGLALLKGGRPLLRWERTEVSFRPLSKDDIERYLDTGEPMGKAGAYAIQGRGAALIRSVRGCYTNVIGLPVPKVLDMLAFAARSR